MTTSPVMTVTDELLAELEDAAGNATQDAWELLPGTNLSGPEVIANGEPIAWVLNSEADAVHIALANPATIAALTAELRRLRAENAELERQNGLLTTAVSDVWKLKEGKIKSACLSQAGDATNWQAEEISRLNIENAELAKDAGRYRWLRDDALNIDGWAPAAVITEGSMIQQCLEGRDLDDEIDTAMAAQ